MRNMSLTAAWCSVPDVPTGSIPNVRGSQVGCVHFQGLTDATHSTLSCISILPFTFSDDLYEILCRLRGKSLVFSCAPCSKRFRSGWQDVVQEVLQNGLEKIMNGLKSSPTISHLLMCAQVKFSVACLLTMPPWSQTIDLFILLQCPGESNVLYVCISTVWGVSRFWGCKGAVRLLSTSCRAEAGEWPVHFTCEISYTCETSYDLISFSYDNITT